MKSREQKREEILRDLREWAALGHETDVETTHLLADEMLLELLGDEEVAEAFRSLTRWYA